jgi:hypothetical protein
MARMIAATPTSKRLSIAVLALIVLSLWGCASSAPPPAAPRSFDNVRRVAVVVTGDSKFAVQENRAEPGKTFDEILGWMPFKQWYMRPLAELVHRGINWLLDSDQSSATGSHVRGISPTAAVSIAFAETLAASDRFQEIQMPEREPVGEERRRLDAIVRVTVPEWGLVRVRAGEPDLHSGFADVRAELISRGSGVVLWETKQDVTDPDRLPLAAFKKDPEFTRQHLLDVLTRAGQRLANELLYAQGPAR